MSSDIRQEVIEQINDRNREGAEILRDVALILAEANQQFCNAQIEAIQAALSEDSQHRASLLKHKPGTPSALEQWPALFQSKAERLIATSAALIKISSQTIIALNQLIERAMLSSILSRQSDAEEQVEVLAERRVSAQMIIFPERRNRNAASEALVESTQYGEAPRRAARKRSSA